MSDNEIIKALEWLILNFPKQEEPNDDSDRLCNCINLYCQNAVDLINRQKEEISKKDIEIDILIRKKEDLSDEVERLKQTSTHIYVDKTAFEECLYNIETAKVDAYNEFAERLKEKSFTPLGTWFTEKVVTDIAISNILKELTEVSNGE